VETMGLEPTTPCLQSRCSSQLSYVPGIVLRPANDPQNLVHHDGTAHDEQNDVPPRACPALSTTDEPSSGFRPADARTLRRAPRDGVVRFVGETVVGLLVYGLLMGMRRRSRRRGLMVGAAAGAAVAHRRGGQEEEPAQQPAEPAQQPEDQAQYAPAPADPADQIEHLAQLHASGALTDEEFASAKAKIIGS
jgi:hypothetical protein